MIGFSVVGTRDAFDIEALSVPVYGGAVGPVGTQGNDSSVCALEMEIRRAGKRMEQSMASGQRDLAVVWMRCMYGLITVRNASVPADIQIGGAA